MIYLFLILAVCIVIALNLKSVSANSSEVLVIKGLGSTKYLSGKGTLIWRFFQRIEKIIPLASTPFNVVATGNTSDGLILKVTASGTVKPVPENVENVSDSMNRLVREAYSIMIPRLTASLNIDTIEEIRDKVKVELPGYIVEMTVTNIEETTGILKELCQAGLQERLTKARLKQQQADHEVAMESEKNRCEQEKAILAREKELGAIRTAERIAAEKRDIMHKKEMDDLKATHANEAAKVQAEREKELASIQKDAAIAKAEADSLYNKKMTEAKKEILDVEIANTKKQQALEEEKAKIEAAKVKARSDNEAYQRKIAAVSEAEANKILVDSEKYKAEVENANELRKGEVEAEILEKKGQAKANAKKMMLEAESTGMAQKATAYQQFNETAEKAMVLEKLPEITKNIGASLKNVDKMNIFSNDGKGADAVTSQVATMMQQSLDVVESVTGMNLAKKEEKKK